MIEVSDVRKNFGGVHALRGVTFQVEPGEVFSLLGPNGAGKTTLVEIMAGNQTPTSGKVRVLGMNPRTAGAALRERIGVVPQIASFELMLTLREHLALFATYYQSALPVDDVIALIGLEDKAHTRVGRLSGGQQRRLDMALALIGDPDITFLDEPTTGFDILARDRAWEIIRLLRNSGKTVVLTTHNLSEAQRLADRVGIVFDGRIVALGPPHRLLGTDDAATVSFRASAGTAAVLPADLSAMAREWDGEVIIPVQDARMAMHELTTWAMESGHPLHGLEVRRPSLEDLYLELVGAEEKAVARS